MASKSYTALESVLKAGMKAQPIKPTQITGITQVGKPQTDFRADMVIPKAPDIGTMQTETQSTTAPLKSGQTGINTPYAPQYTPPVTDLSGMIKQQSQAQGNSLLAALKQRISEATANQQKLIATAPQQYDPLRAESEVRKVQEQTTALEQAANAGDRGGIGRQNVLMTQVAGEGRIANYNLAQQNLIDDANAEIMRLQNEGKTGEAQIMADVANNELSALLQEQARQDNLNQSNYQYGTQLKTQAENTAYNREQDVYNKEQDAIQREIDAATTTYNRDRQAEQDALNEWYKYQTIVAKTAAQKLAEKKAEQAYNVAKQRAGISAGNLSLAQKKYANKGSSGSSGSSKTTGTTKKTGLDIFYNKEE